MHTQESSEPGVVHTRRPNSRTGQPSCVLTSAFEQATRAPQHPQRQRRERPKPPARLANTGAPVPARRSGRRTNTNHDGLQKPPAIPRSRKTRTRRQQRFRRRHSSRLDRLATRGSRKGGAGRRKYCPAPTSLLRTCVGTGTGRLQVCKPRPTNHKTTTVRNGARRCIRVVLRRVSNIWTL